MIYKRGNIYWCKFKHKGQEIRRSLKVRDLEKARRREEHIKQTLIQAEWARRDSAFPEMTKPWHLQLDLSKEEAKRLVKRMYQGMKDRAAKKGLPFSITLDQLKQKLLDSQGLCAVSGARLDIYSKVYGQRVGPWHPSVDRIDSNQGYTYKNCRIVCYLANLAMSQYGEVHLIELARLVVAKQLGGSNGVQQRGYNGSNSTENIEVFSKYRRTLNP